MVPRKNQKIIVIGAGPVGALAALYAAQRGYNVEVYELRSDLRLESTQLVGFTRSVNLAMSERGVNSIRKAGRPELLDRILRGTVPMHARMVHGNKNNKLVEAPQEYDAHGRIVRATDRAGLNKALLDELEATHNVQLFFNHKLKRTDFERKMIWLEDREQNDSKDDRSLWDSSHSPQAPKEVEVSFDFLVGADGAHSIVRSNLMRVSNMFYQQEYIDAMWCEFMIRPGSIEDSKDTYFKISPDYFHIWPAGEYVFIAIPNVDKSFTCTLFMPAAIFASMDEKPEKIVPFFESSFPGLAHSLISPKDLKKQYENNPHLPLISIKCSPYHFKSSAVIVGDAAHAMVPFYGQGMNAGLEDVRVLFDILDKHSRVSTDDLSNEDEDNVRAAALEEYTTIRKPDAHAINDLAMDNYEELRSDVNSKLYLLRKYVEETLYVYFPGLDIKTRYTRVSFSNERYSEVVKATRKQGNLLAMTGATLGALTAVWAITAFRWQRR